MNRKMVYGMFILFLLSMPFIFSNYNNNFQNSQKISSSSPETLNILGVNVTSPADLTLLYNDSTNQTLSWTLIENRSRDYAGLYNFTSDVDGNYPVGWTVLDYGTDATLQVISEYANHRKVLEFRDDYLSTSSAMAQMEQTFTARTTGTIELWVYGKEGTLNHNMFGISLFSSATHAIHTLIDWTSGVANYVNCRNNILLDQQIVSSPNFPADQWIHIRIVFNCASDTFVCYVDGVNRGTFNFRNAVTSVNRIIVGTGQIESGGNFTAYVDALDYSWAPSYYLNRNMDSTPGPLDYQGLYSFSSDIVGGNPTGWPTVEGGLTSLQVIQEWVSHSKVVDIYDANPASYSDMSNSFSARATGTVEFWVYGNPSVTGDNNIQISFKSGGYSGTNGPGIIIDYKMQKLRYAVGGTAYNITDCANNQWHHIRVAFDSNSDTFDIWLDQALVGNDLAYQFTTGNIDELVFYSGTASNGGFHTYLDAIDYSWAPGYYTNRNTDTGFLVYSVFQNGIQQTPWQQWNTQAQIDYTLSGLGLGLGIYNMSLVFNNSQHIWSHDDVIVTVREAQQPTIGQVAHNVKTVAAHISDNTQIQNAYVETNATSTIPTGNYLGLYSFLNDPNGATPEGWDLMFLQGTAHLYVTEAKSGHHKVVEGYDNGATSGGDLISSWPVRATGSIEFWYCGTLGTGTDQDMTITVIGVGCNGYIQGPVLVMDLDAAKIDSINSSGSRATIFSAALTNWTHFLIDFNCNTDKFNLTVNGALVGLNLQFRYNLTVTTGIQISTGWASSGGFYFYLDSIDYSWAPGYYLNRNMQIDSFENYSMSLDSGTLQDGSWTYTFTPPPLNSIISYRIYAQDLWGNINSTDQLYINYSDPLSPNIANVVQTPPLPGYQETVNVTVHLTDNIEIQDVYIETNCSMLLLNYSMSLLSGSLSDGLWTYAFNNYPTNSSILYRIFVQDTFGNWNATGYYSFGYFDLLGPNILSVTQEPSEPTYLDIVNVTVRVTDATQVQTVSIQSNQTGAFSTFPLSLISGTLNDGIWKFTFGICPVNQTISYRILAQDVLGNQNNTTYNSFGYFDLFGPNILSVTQNPSEPTYLDIVNVTVRVTDATQVQTVSIQTNYTGAFSTYPMNLISGTLNDGVWKFTFTTYPLNAIIIYSISSEDVFGNSNSSDQTGFGVFDLIDPAILTVVQTPAALTKWEAVKVTVHIQENFALKNVMLNSNYTGSWVDYPMTLLNGSLQDGFWEYTVISYPYNSSIWYRISATDVVERVTITNYSQFGIFPIVSTNVPLDLDFQVDIGMAGTKSTDITFEFQNTGNTNLVNINFTIQLPTGWTTNTLVQSVPQLAPGQTVTITFTIWVPGDIGEFTAELVVVNVNARVAELDLDWPTQYIEVVVSGVKVWDLFIWLVIIVGSASAAVATTYVYIHKRSVRQRASMEIKAKSIAAISETLSKDIPIPLSAISMEIIEKIENLHDITSDEKILLIQYISQLEEEDALIYLDQLKETETN